MSAFLQDVRYCLRMLAKNRGFTAVAVLTLAVGIGATTTVFSWIDAVLLHPIGGVAHAEQLVSFETRTPDGQPTPTSYPDFQDYRDYLHLPLAMARPTSFSVGSNDHPERVWGELVSGNFFDVLGVRPAMGRAFLPQEFGDKPNGFPIAVISHRYWNSHFNADAAIVGKTIIVNRQPITVVGVAPADFHGSMAGLAFDLWIPYVMQPELQGVGEWMLRDRKTRNLLGILRIPPGHSRTEYQQQITALAARMAKAQPYEDGGMSGVLVPLWKSHFGPQDLLLAPFQILMAACCLVLLIVCANVGNLLLARFTARAREFAMKLTLGATRLRLARQIFTEGLVLAVLATAVGLAMVAWLGGVLPLLLPARDLPFIVGAAVNRTVLFFSAFLCGATAIMSGLPPLLQAFRANLHETVKDAGRTASSGLRSHRLRAVLVVSEVALALLALIGAGLFVRGFRAASHINPGFDANNVVLAQFAINTSGYTVAERKEFCRRLRQRIESGPGIVAVSYSDGAPLGIEPSWWEDLTIRGYQPAPGENMKIYRNVVAPGYFATLHIPLDAGRDFTEQDERDTTPVMIVSQSFVKRFFAGGNALGRQVYGWGNWFTVVGVARDAKYNNLAESDTPYFYVPFRQVYRADMNLSFYVRTAGGDPDQAIGLIRQEARSLDPNLPLIHALPLAEYISASLYPQRVAATLLAILGALSLLLAAVGLYSVLAYSVMQRTHEIGIRMALGAQIGDVMRLILRHGMGLAALGLGFGIAAALLVAPRLAGVTVSGPTMGGAGSLLASQAVDPAIYGGAALFLAGIAALASYIPARRATRVDPMVTLRHE